VSKSGPVDVVVTNPSGASGRLPAGFTYVVMAVPAITSVSADPGSTEGGAFVSIAGTGFQPGAQVSFGGTRIVATLVGSELHGMTPPHAAGVVDVTVINPDGQSGTLSGAYIYVDPASLDFNGEWEGYGTEGETSLRFTIRDNLLTAVSCGLSPDGAAAVTVGPSPAPQVNRGAVSFFGPEGVFTARVVTGRSASGTIRFDRCFPGQASWWGAKR